MTDKTIDLDRRRGMEAQKATDLRRFLAEVEANERALRLRQEELEAHLALCLPKTKSDSIGDEVHRGWALQGCLRAAGLGEDAAHPLPERDASGLGFSKQHRL